MKLTEAINKYYEDNNEEKLYESVARAKILYNEKQEILQGILGDKYNKQILTDIIDKNIAKRAMEGPFRMITDILMDSSNTKPQRLPDEDLDIIRYGEALWEKNHSDNKDDLKDIKAIIAKRKKLNNNAKKTILPPLTADTPVHSYVDTLNTAKKEILEQYKKDNDLQKVYESVARLDTSIDNKILLLQDILPDDYDEGVLMTTIALHLFERAAQRFL